MEWWLLPVQAIFFFLNIVGFFFKFCVHDCCISGCFLIKRLKVNLIIKTVLKQQGCRGLTILKRIILLYCGITGWFGPSVWWNFSWAACPAQLTSPSLVLWKNEPTERVSILTKGTVAIAWTWWERPLDFGGILGYCRNTVLQLMSHFTSRFENNKFLHADIVYM